MSGAPGSWPASDIGAALELPWWWFGELPLPVIIKSNPYLHTPYPLPSSTILLQCFLFVVVFNRWGRRGLFRALISLSLVLLLLLFVIISIAVLTYCFSLLSLVLLLLLSSLFSKHVSGLLRAGARAAPARGSAAPGRPRRATDGSLALLLLVLLVRTLIILIMRLLILQIPEKMQGHKGGNTASVSARRQGESSITSMGKGFTHAISCIVIIKCYSHVLSIAIIIIVIAIGYQV